MANIRRGLERVGKVLMVWGFLMTFLFFGLLIIVSTPISPYETMPRLKDLLAFWIAVGWGPFLLFKLLYWIGSGFVDDPADDDA